LQIIRSRSPFAPLVSASSQLDSRSVDGLFRRILREANREAHETDDRRARVGFLTRWTLWAGVRVGAWLNPARRPGSLASLPLVLLILGAEAAATIAAIYGLDRLAHWIF